MLSCRLATSPFTRPCTLLKYTALDFGQSEIDCAICDVFAGSAFNAPVTSTQSSACR